MFWSDKTDRELYIKNQQQWLKNKSAVQNKEFNNIPVASPITLELKDVTQTRMPFDYSLYDVTLPNITEKLLKPFGIKPTVLYLPSKLNHKEWTGKSMIDYWKWFNKGMHPILQSHKPIVRNGQLYVPHISYQFNEEFQKFVTRENFETFKAKNPNMKLSDADKNKIYNKKISNDSKQKKSTVSSKPSIQRSFDKWFRPVSSVLKGYGTPELKRIVRKQVTDAMITASNWNAQARPFVEYLINLETTHPDLFEDLSLALYNGDIEMVETIMEKTNMTVPGSIEDYMQVVSLTDNIYNEALSVGTEMNKIDNYYPRKVKDLDGLWNLLGVNEKSEYERALREKEKEIGSQLTELQKTEFLNSFLAGYVPRGNGKPGYVKGRNIDLVTRDMLPYYEKPYDSMLDYIDRFSESNSILRSFGKGNPEESIGHFVNEQLIKGNIKPEQVDEIKELLREYYQPGSYGAWVHPLRNTVYTGTMGSVWSAITQVGDQPWAMIEGGIVRTLHNDLKAILGQSEIKVSDLNLQSMMHELQSKTKTGELVNTVFTLCGLTFIDRLGKEAIINNTLQKYRNYARGIEDQQFLKEFREEKDKARLNEYFSEEQQIQLWKDLQSDEVTDLVKELVLNVVLDWQPVAKSEVPLKHKDHPFLYQLKTYTVKQMNAFKDNLYDEIKRESENFKNAKTEEEKAGAKERLQQAIIYLLTLTGMFMTANGVADATKDTLAGRDIELDDLAYQQLWKLFGTSRYVQFQIKNEGVVWGLLKQYIIPANVSVLSDVGFDVFGRNISKFDPDEKVGILIRYQESKEFDKLKKRGFDNLNDKEQKRYEHLEWKLKTPLIHQLKSINFLPMFGKGYYWHYGQGHKKTIMNRLYKTKKDVGNYDDGYTQDSALSVQNSINYVNNLNYALENNMIKPNKYHKELEFATNYRFYRDKLSKTSDWDASDVELYRKAVDDLYNFNIPDFDEALKYKRKWQDIETFYKNKW